MTFRQTPPAPGNQYDDDRVLRSYLRRVLPEEMLHEIEDDLREMGRLAGGAWYALQQADLPNEPVLTQWDAWGERVDRIAVTRVWAEAEREAARRGVVATAYERKHGAFSRPHQFALAYLFMPSTDMYGCPLAMTDGAARTLLDAGNETLIARAVPRLTTRDPERFWTSGQWMTELTGGSDVGRSETVARRGDDGVWRLYGRKWFTSAVTSQMALTLARPEGNPPGGKGLALFYVETRDENGRLRNIRMDRLKDKLGTRKLPTAELTLDGMPALPVAGLDDGVRRITPMLNLTRTWNAVTAAAYMRRVLALARDYARKRIAFGAPLTEQPLHVDTLAGLQAEYEGAFHLAFRLAELLGHAEAEIITEDHAALLRLLTPIAKLTTARQAVTVTSEVLEAFGGAGYVEDTGLPTLHRDAQVLSIWEGTTNVLALDALRAVHTTGGLATLNAEIDGCAAEVRAPDLGEVVQAAGRAVRTAESWLGAAMRAGRPLVEAGARRFALTLGRALEAALLARHAQWSLDHERDARAAAAARRFAAHGIERLAPMPPEEARALALDAPFPVANVSA